MARSLRLRVFSAVTLLALVFATGCAASQTGGSGAPAASGDDSQLVQTKCTMCHPYDRVSEAKYDAAGWTQVVERMQKNGLVVTDEEKARIIAFLAAQ